MVRTNVVVEIDSSFIKGSSGISAHTVKCLICGERKDITWQFNEEDFWKEQLAFVKKHSHIDYEGISENNVKKIREILLDKSKDKVWIIKDIVIHLIQNEPLENRKRILTDIVAHFKDFPVDMV